MNPASIWYRKKVEAVCGGAESHCNFCKNIIAGDFCSKRFKTPEKALTASGAIRNMRLVP
ncbi:hypothetical protein GA0061071_103383 [Kosakonia oryzendophytica]|uniref:Uncharacterized protein n=1 Tax=Kosakonia oryzendophytica TaxID=1005665 RepID=A0A1C4AW34_9ENTR|nr:hypothetical protein GA0061071_103383 [Kosakonia oryzendophytica]